MSGVIDSLPLPELSRAVTGFVEFFAGGGMARAGLGPAWECLWANDFSPSKAEAYRANWGGAELHEEDVAGVRPEDLPDSTLAWASFPCQDLSLAGDQNGIGSEETPVASRSGTFWQFWRLIRIKRPAIIVLENVVGALSSNKGRDIQAITSALSGSDYRFGPLVMDACHFLPQSRPRLFIIAVRKDIPIPGDLLTVNPNPLWHPESVIRAQRAAAPQALSRWLWWALPKPRGKVPALESFIDAEPAGWNTWNDQAQTDYLISLMTPANRQKVLQAQRLGKRVVGTGYRRTRLGKQRLELRFDGVAGCLRTAAGGSSRQIVIEVRGSHLRTRLMTPREAARLQGLPEDYWLPKSYTDAYDLAGDGLCVPVVAYLREHILSPLALSLRKPAPLLATA